LGITISFSIYLICAEQVLYPIRIDSIMPGRCMAVLLIILKPDHAIVPTLDAPKQPFGALS
jgi:hypothetical protein